MIQSKICVMARQMKVLKLPMKSLLYRVVKFCQNIKSAICVNTGKRSARFTLMLDANILTVWTVYAKQVNF